MVDNIFFTSANDSLTNFIRNEWPDFPALFMNQLTNFISFIGNYEEEGAKIRPKILITNNISSISGSIATSYILSLFKDETESLFGSRIKSLAPFCLHRWSIFVNIDENGYTYGIYKTLNSIKDKDFNTLMFEKKALKDKTDEIFAILIRPLSSLNVNLKSLKGEELNINLSFQQRRVINWKEEIKEFVDASFSKLRTTSKKLDEIKTLYYNIFENVIENVHGCICAVIDKDYQDDGFFKDGIWLDNPICFSKLFTQSKSYSEPKLIGISNLFIDMLNYDGITLIDNLGRIRAYNVFVENEQSRENNIIGGARKRAAFTIINSKNKKIKGVYFQSQDGEMFYQRVRKPDKPTKNKNYFTSLTD